MANNLHVSYDLYNPGQNYERVIDAIKALGSWAKIHKSYWYVKSNLTAQQAAQKVWAVMDQNDTVYVVNATDNTAWWFNISEEAAKFINQKWSQ